jgi:hypothetical protein
MGIYTINSEDNYNNTRFIQITNRLNSVLIIFFFYFSKNDITTSANKNEKEDDLIAASINLAPPKVTSQTGGKVN